MIVLSTKLRLFAMSVGPVVVTGLYLDLVSRAEREAVISHEIGHIIHLHALKRIWWILSGRWSGIQQRCRNQEFEADRYAVMNGHGGPMLRFLNRTRTPHNSAFHPSSDERIAAIRRFHVI